MQKRKRKNGKRSGNWVSKAERLARYLRDGFLCQYCGKDLHDASPREISLDHLKCRVNGGSDDAKNTVTACLSCNSRRQHKAWKSYATGGAIERILRTRRRSMTKYRKLAKALINGEAHNLRVEAQS
jgi:hypothetical protein